MRLHLIDKAPQVVSAWRESFSDLDDVEIWEGDLLSIARDTIISPANSHGEMGGGIDLAYRNHFGREIETILQKEIRKNCGSYLPIGKALRIATGDTTIPYLISAPTMFLPEPTSQLNVYKAALAAFRCALEHNAQDVFCPGFGTGVGCVPYPDAAVAMRGAFNDAIRTPPNE